MRAWTLLLVFLLLPLVGAYELVITPVGGDVSTAAEVNGVKVTAEKSIEVLGVQREGSTVSLVLSVALPTPCHKLGEPFVSTQETSNTVEATIQLPIYPEGNVCIQRVERVTTSVSFEADPEKNVVARVHAQLVTNQSRERVTVRNYAGVKYTVSTTGNTVILTLDGCYNVDVRPLRCPSCYEVELEPKEECNDENTVISLEVSGDFEPLVILRRKGTVTVMTTGVEIPAVLECNKAIAELNRVAPDIAKEFQIRCREKGLEIAAKEACEQLKEMNEEAYKAVCGALSIGKTGREIGRAAREGNIERVSEIIRKLKEEVKRFTEEMKKLKLRAEEIRARIRITPAGIVIEDENIEELPIPEVEIEVKVKRKPVVVKKEENEIYIEVNGPIRARVKVRAPVEIDENKILVAGKPVKILPDEVLAKIKERLRVKEEKEVELTVENNKPVYRVEAVARGRLLFILPVEVPVEVKVDAETGAELEVRRPWWAFLVFP